MPDDTQTAPPSSQPPAPIQTETPPGLTAMLPYQAIPESTGVTAPSPQPIQTDPGSPLTATIPSETPPNNPDIERQYHEGWLRQKMDQAARVLGGGETITYTKDADGNVSMTHSPSTTKEMWGRVAQAALVGAASGLANSQGPGGLAKAAAAGVQTGAQLPQQRVQQAQQNVDFDNKQLLAKANRIHLTQQSVMEAAQARLANLKVDQETAKVMNESLQDYQGRPGATDYGGFDPGDRNGVIDLTKNMPGAMDDYLGKNNRKAAVVLEADHKLHVIGYNATDDDRWNDKPVEVPYNDMDKDGKPIISTKTVGPGTHRQGELDLNRDAVQAEYLKRLNTWSTAQKSQADANKQPAGPKTIDEMRLRRNQTTDPVERAQLDATINAHDNSPEAQARIAHERAETGRAVAETRKAELGMGEGSQGSALVDSIGTGKITVDRLAYLVARNPDLLTAVTQKYPDFDSAKAATYPGVYKDYTSTKPGTAGGTLVAGGTALMHLKELNDMNTPASHIPGTPAYTAYVNKVDTVADELGAFYHNTTIPAIKAIKDTLASTLPGNRQAAIQTQAQSMGDRLDNYETAWTNAAPSSMYQAPMPGISPKAKEARAALDPKYRTRQVQQLQGSTPQPNPTPTNAPPPGAISVAVPGGKTYHFPNQAAADTFKANARKQGVNIP